MAKINLYVPDELKRKIEERPDLNWSQIFCNCAELMLETQPKRDIIHAASKPRRH